jgi:hypothetical protein
MKYLIFLPITLLSFGVAFGDKDIKPWLTGGLSDEGTANTDEGAGSDGDSDQLGTIHLDGV